MVTEARLLASMRDMSDTVGPSRSMLDALPLSRRGIIVFSLGAAAAFTILSWAIIVFYRRRSFFSVFDGEVPLGTQIVSGGFAGSILGALIAIMHRPRWRTGRPCEPSFGRFSRACGRASSIC